MAEVVATANQSNFLSRQEMLQWINEVLKMKEQKQQVILFDGKLNEKKIENLGTGAIFCQLFDMCYPGKVQMSKVNWKAKYENEYVANFKILQQAFDRMSVNKPIDVNKLIKCKYQDNLEFLQWMRKYHDQFRKNDKPYDAISRRNGQLVLDSLQDKALIPQHPHLQASQSTGVEACAVSVVSNSSNNKQAFLRNSNKKNNTAYLISGETKQFSNSCQSSVSNLSMDQDCAQIDDNEPKVDHFSIVSYLNNPTSLANNNNNGSTNNLLGNNILNQNNSSNNNNANNNNSNNNILSGLLSNIERESAIERLSEERDFFFEKLKLVDQLLDGVNPNSGHSAVDVKRLIKCILYSTKDNILTVLDDGQVTLTDKNMLDIKINSFETFQGLEQLQKDILSTDAAIKKIDKKHKKNKLSFSSYDPNQENKQQLPPTYPTNQESTLNKSSSQYNNNANNNNHSNSHSSSNILQVVTQNKEEFKTPVSGKYSYEQALQLDDFSASLSSNTNQAHSRKNSGPLYEILINNEQLTNKQTQKLTLAPQDSANSNNTIQLTPKSGHGDVIKLKQIQEVIPQPQPPGLFDKLSENIFESQDEDLLGNLE